VRFLAQNGHAPSTGPNRNCLPRDGLKFGPFGPVDKMGYCRSDGRARRGSARLLAWTGVVRARVPLCWSASSSLAEAPNTEHSSVPQGPHRAPLRHLPHERWSSRLSPRDDPATGRQLATNEVADFGAHPWMRSSGLSGGFVRQPPSLRDADEPPEVCLSFPARASSTDAKPTYPELRRGSTHRGPI
jgi:hypothetical protein